MGEDMKNIFDFSYEKLVSFLIDNGFKKYNADQIIDWVYKKHVYDFNKMSNLSKNLISFLCENFTFDFIEIVKEEKDIDTSKYLFKLNDGNYIEAVLMKHNYGVSLCVSSQVGCNMGCSFCESGRLKKVRDLTVSEMVMQVILIEDKLGKKINNLVLMGIGEPFDNYDNVMDFIRILTNNKMINLGQRKITVSTCGIIPKIYEFMNEDMQVNLAISLHAAFDETRNKLMKINKVYPLKDLLEAIDKYIEKTGRRVTIEYIMLDKVNDRDIDAENLVKLFKNKLIYINLIPYNNVESFTYKKSKKSQILKFYDILKKGNINVTIRREFGSNVSAACGQLRGRACKEGESCL